MMKNCFKSEHDDASVKRYYLNLVLLVLLTFPTLSSYVYALSDKSYITTIKTENDFVLSASGKSVPLYVSSNDYPGVIRVAKQLQSDIKKVTGAMPSLIIDGKQVSGEPVLIGTIGKSRLIDKLINDKKLDVQDIAGKWETFLIQVVENPFPKVNRALVIAGSDKRGTIYGIYDLSEKIGVSPWHWWADVPVRKRQALYVIPGRYTQGEPKVKYRGIFINDEAPALTGFVKEKFGNYNSKFYEHVFELILRLKGNYLWPAMWDNSFATDDPLNPKLADEYGIVMGTSHHEPMMRAWKEWVRAGNPPGSWNYSKNPEALRKFWKEGIRRSKNYENIITLAMRGDGDEPMSQEADIALLERIVEDQRKIISNVTGKDVTTIPQVWAIYKEVQEYYDKGMKVPDDVTVLLCDDNWGNVRRLPELNAKSRKGGYGMYYHFDFVGGPVSYKWLNTIQIERVWEQMHLSYEYGIRQIWIVNVGDIKPMELPISFFLDYAWNPDEWTADRLPEYYKLWAEQQFPKEQIGVDYSADIAEILATYTKYNSRRKPEMLSPNTYSLINYREAETIVSDYNNLAEKAKRIYDTIPAIYKDAYYQLVLHPVIACANLNELYVTVGKNRLYAKQGRASTNVLAEKAYGLFDKDVVITYYYNNVLSKGKWNHMMDQTHIGYTSWQEPKKNTMPEVKLIRIPESGDMGVAIEGSENFWPDSSQYEAVLPEFDVYHQQNYYIDIFNKGKAEFEYTIRPNNNWVLISVAKGKIKVEERIWVSIDWEKAPKGKNKVPIVIEGPKKDKVIVYAVVNNPESPKRELIDGFVESNGYVSIEAENFSNVVNTKSIKWLRIPNLGRTGSAMTTMPVKIETQILDENSPRLEYKVHLFSKGEVTVKVYISPTLNFRGDDGLRYAVSFDDEPPQLVYIHKYDRGADWNYPMWWNESVSNNIRILTSKHNISKEGEHVLKIWMLDPAVVLQKIVIDAGGLKPSYLGPPESFNRKLVNKGGN